MKRFTETDKWRDAWFRKLSPKHKCLWQYLLDNCDAAGVIDVDWELATFQIGEQVCPGDLAYFDRQVARLENGKVHVVGFIEYQYRVISRDCKAHGPVFASIEKHNLDRVSKGYPKGIHTPQDKDKDKDKDKEKDKDQETAEKSPVQRRAEKLLGKRETTPWDKSELRAWKDAERIVSETSDEEWRALERFYALPQSETFARKTLAALLNNWSGEIQRATNHKPKGHAGSTYEQEAAAHGYTL